MLCDINEEDEKEVSGGEAIDAHRLRQSLSVRQFNAVLVDEAGILNLSRFLLIASPTGCW